MSNCLNKDRVLLVSPDYLGLYIDIYHGLVNLGYDTEVIVTKTIKGDPFLVRNKNTKKSKTVLLNELREFWVKIIKSGNYSFHYDYLIAIDGTCLHPYLFDVLKNNNPNIITINYLFDGIENVYRFDRNFPFFDRIFTFDIADSIKYHLKHLPIYWVDRDSVGVIERDIFAFGAYNKTRGNIFKLIKRSIPRDNISSYIKLYIPRSQGWYHRIRLFVRTLLMPRYYGMITHTSFPTEEFRRMISTSKIIVDTSNGYQDGLSARFMWALGLGRKIITNNISAIKYGFYTKEQIYIIGPDSSSLSDFIMSDYIMTDDIRNMVNCYRIDNWIKTLMN